ncbi:MAG: excinuclease ABC subunit UvrC [Burkholderiales bacterium]
MSPKDKTNVEVLEFAADEIIEHLPHLPGVYRMLGQARQVLYVGKAKDLKKRVASYFQKSESLAPRIRLMVAQVQGIETTITRSEAEALLLENNLIKSLAPRYNILFRDDKSYPYIVLTGHPFPRLGFHRGPLDKNHRYFGPFPNAGAVRQSIQLLQKIFRLRTCEDTVFANRTRPCLLYQIRRCTGSCTGHIGEEDYSDDVQNAELFLKGKTTEAVSRLEERMVRSAQDQAYEQAAGYRDQIRSLSRVRETQFVSSNRGVDADVVALAVTEEIICVNLVMIRGGIHLGDRSFFPQNAQQQDESFALEAFLTQHYVNGEVPPTIYLNRAIDAASIEEFLGLQAGTSVRINTSSTGEPRVWLRMAEKNAEMAIAQRMATHASQEGRLLELQGALSLSDTVRRIECFDISHTMGEATVASCVVYDHDAMQPSEYRRYNIQGVAAGDDYGAMRQALGRRYRKIVEGEGKLPDLILIDGGKGQLGVAVEVLGELGLSQVPLLGVAKGLARKPGLEQLFSPSRNEPIQLAPDHPGLHLIQQIRDEAHRFAISGHRNRRAKVRNRSALEDIGGIGPKRRQRLLSRFGGLKNLASASIEEIARVEGISIKLAEKIYQQLH